MRTTFNTGWAVKPKQNVFSELTGRGGAGPEAVTLPHDALIASERDPSGSHQTAYFPRGVWSYEKTFDVPFDWADRCVRLQFEGVYSDAMVFVNDDFAASEPYGYGEFVVDLDPFLRPGEENTVKVECRAGDDARWYSGAGIYRPVHLWVQEPVHLAIDGVWVTTPDIDERGALVEIAAEVCNETRHTVTANLQSDVVDDSGEVVALGIIPVTIRANETVTARQRLHVADPHRWSPDAPNLYSCVTTLSSEPVASVPDPDATGSREVDRNTTSFGIRSLQLDARHGLRINGQAVKLRGACVHHDNGPIGAATIDRAEERRVELLQEAGFNAIRSSHNPMSRAMLDACDRLGVIVMDEAWDVWNDGKSDRDYALRFGSRWQSDLAAMVRKDRNHPSVVLYSIGNEIPEIGSPLGSARAREIAEHLRRLDHTRFVTNALQPLLAIRDLITKIRDLTSRQDVGAHDAAEVAADQGTPTPQVDMPVDGPQGVNSQMASWTDSMDRLLVAPMVDECMEEASGSLDVVGYNYLDVRYVLDHDLHPNRVIVGSETYVTKLARAWPTIVAHDHVIGDFTWTGWDYLGEVGIGRVEYGEQDEQSPANVVGEFPWLLAHAGDIDITGVRRSQSYFREIVFGLRSEPFIAVGRPAHAGEPIRFAGPWSWSDTLDSWTWPGFDGTEVRVEVYAAAGEVELLLDGESLGRRPCGPGHGFYAEFNVGYRPGELVAIGYDGGEESGRRVLRTASGPNRLHVDVDRREIVAGDSDLAFVSIRLADEDGVIDPTDVRELTVDIDGPGMLQGFASADPLSTVRFTSPTCRTYDGRALAVIRPTGSGTIVLTIGADGLDSTTIELTALDSLASEV